MFLILQTLFLSIAVGWRMIIPTILITLAAPFVWIPFSILTLGYSSYVSTQITLIFIMLYGVRKALELKGDRSHTDLRVLATYSVAFGLVLEAVKFVGDYAVGRLAIYATETRMDGAVTLQSIQSVDESLRTAFGLNFITFIVIFGLVLYAAVQAAFAVPMAAAARSAGRGAPSITFMDGFGRSFVPLFILFFVTIFLQVFFQIFAFIFGAFIVLVAQLTRTINLLAAYFGSSERVTTELFEALDPMTFVYALFAIFVLLWLNAIISSASALALIKYNGTCETQRVANRAASAAQPSDLRALRKRRESGTL